MPSMGWTAPLLARIAATAARAVPGSTVRGIVLSGTVTLDRAGPRRRSARRRGKRASRPMDKDEYRSEARDGMLIYWDVPVRMPDGTVLRADVYRPPAEGRYPVTMTHGPYAKELAFEAACAGRSRAL